MLRIAGARSWAKQRGEDGQLTLAPSPQLSPAFPQTSELSPEPEPDTGPHWLCLGTCNLFLVFPVIWRIFKDFYLGPI